MMDFVFRRNIKNIRIDLNNPLGVELYIKPEYLNHPIISGNKLRKLRYNLKVLKAKGRETLLTFGGAYSNHIAATAYAGKVYGIKTIGIIRGQELINNFRENPTLTFAKENGMRFHFVSRSEYREKENSEIVKKLRGINSDIFVLPEGGTNNLAVKGCEEILTNEDRAFDFICCPVGTGGTISGLINASEENQKILGFPALKGDFLIEQITNYTSRNNWDLVEEYHFGGYAKINRILIEFINKFRADFDVPLDPIYTGKMMFGIFEMIKKEYFPQGSKILAVHTGGLQGIEGMNQSLKHKNWPLIS